MTIATVDTKVTQVISNIRNLPTPPIVFHQIQKVLNDPKVSAGQIASILSEDPAMSVKVLKLTNSAFYGLPREVDSVKQAVVIVGLAAVKNLVLAASVLDMFKGKDSDQESQEKFWRHSLAVGFSGRLLARHSRVRGMIDPDSVFSGGLLHDIGKVVMSCFLKKEYAEFIEERQKDTVTPTFEVEERVLGYNHADIGGVLAEQWKLPSRLKQAVAFHHRPQLSTSDDPIAYVVHVANYIAKKTFYDNDDKYLVGTMEPSVVDYMQITDEDIESYSEKLREEYVKAETFMKMTGFG